MTRNDGWTFANGWVDAWNSHDLDRIMKHYAESIELVSPVAARILNLADGKAVGKRNLRTYFRLGLNAYPNLRFSMETYSGASTAWFSITQIKAVARPLSLWNCSTPAW